MGISLILVPLTINYLDNARYGIWVTLTSIVSWLTLFDVGLGHGLRNRFAEAIAQDDNLNAKKYVSTAYIVLSLIVISIILIFFIFNLLVDWNKILNVDSKIISRIELKIVAFITFTFFAINLLLQLINSLLNATQEPSKAAVNDFLGKFLGLIIILILVHLSNKSFILLGLVLSSAPVITLLIISFYFFNKKFKEFIPSINFFDKSKVKDLFNLSTKFFVIRISAIILYSTNNLIISNLFGPTEVTSYNITLSYFNVLFLLYNIVITPFWSAFTEAWVKNEISWIKKAMKFLLIFWLILLIIGFLMLLFSNFVINIWIGGKVSIPFFMSLFVCIWVLMITWNGIFSQFLYGIGAITLQSIIAFSVSVVNIPLSIYFGRILGIKGILLVGIFLAFIQMWIYPYQYFKIINKKASGIWSK
jgi:O-antigen/teichoic acid export membrane protein